MQPPTRARSRFVIRDLTRTRQGQALCDQHLEAPEESGPPGAMRDRQDHGADIRELTDQDERI